ncbi:MAG: hypothetical protein ACI9JL_002431 [Paracoccaceae bacterium]|jgi:hypothetical protein
MKMHSLAIVALLGLSACAMPNLDALTGSKKPTTMESATASGVKGDPMRIDTIAFADAYCRKDGIAAVAASQKLVVANPNHPRALLNYGLSLDLAGRGIAAYRVLGPLGKAGHTMPTVLQCGDDFIYSGTVTEVAQRRLFDIKTSLTALGMTMPLPSAKETKMGSNTVYRLAALAPSKDEMDANQARPAVKMVKHAPAKPKMAHKSGKAGKTGHFVHLGSYKSTRNLDRGWRNLRKRFSKVLGGQPKSVSAINLGKKKGRYLRLGVKVASAKTARDICKRLKAGGQYCVIRRARKS